MKIPNCDTSFKAYMDYRCITNKASDQYKLQLSAWTDDMGLRRVDNYYLVGRVVTKKEYRNKGYSSKIFRFIEEMALNEGINTIKLHAQDVSLGYYLKLGFKITSEQYIEAGVEHHNIEKNF